jgi:hypothetical protein
MKNQPTMMVEKELDALQAELAELKKDWPEIPEAYPKSVNGKAPNLARKLIEWANGVSNCPSQSSLKR